MIATNPTIHRETLLNSMNGNGNKSMKEIALDLLEKYIEDEVSLMCEFSYNFKEDEKVIWEKVQGYLKDMGINDFDIEEKFKNMIFRY